MPRRPTKDYHFECRGGVATITIFDVIDRFGGISSRDIAADLKAAGDVKTLRVHVNSEGGEAFEGIAIYNLFLNHPARVEMFVDGLALSVAALIVMAGDHIVIAKSARMMIHNPMGGGFSAPAEEHRSLAALLDSLTNTIAEITAKRTGQTIEKIVELMAAETWFTAEQAVAIGLADEEGKALKVAAHVDAGLYSHTPQELIAQHKEPIMAEEQKPADNTPTPLAAASFEELEGSLPGADSDFVMSQLRAKATLPQALVAWMTAQNERLAKSQKETDAATKAGEKAVAEAKATVKPGLDVKGEGEGNSGDGNEAAYGGDPIAEWNKRLQAKVDANMPRMQAASRLNAEEPGLREAMVDAYNLQQKAAVAAA